MQTVTAPAATTLGPLGDMLGTDPVTFLCRPEARLPVAEEDELGHVRRLSDVCLAVLRQDSRPLGVLLDGTGKSVVIDSQITPVRPYLLQWPGASDTAGIRDIINNSQLLGRADTTAGITTLFYNFKEQYGDDTQGNRLNNAITEAPKQRFRYLLDL